MFETEINEINEIQIPDQIDQIEQIEKFVENHELFEALSVIDQISDKDACESCGDVSHPDGIKNSKQACQACGDPNHCQKISGLKSTQTGIRAKPTQRNHPLRFPESNSSDADQLAMKQALEGLM